MKGWVGLGWLVTYRDKVPPPWVEPGHVTQPSTNWARRRVTSLIRPTLLPLRHATTMSHGIVIMWCSFLWVGMWSHATAGSSWPDAERDELCSAHWLRCRCFASFASSGAISLPAAVFTGFWDVHSCCRLLTIHESDSGPAELCSLWNGSWVAWAGDDDVFEPQPPPPFQQLFTRDSGLFGSRLILYLRVFQKKTCRIHGTASFVNHVPFC